ncbi:MAG: hypothetical protein LBQ79_08205 [Deltaproteobacteria bacterium]|jgi:hypothetical protein|nr:hypothetical protein [Deltaproteobacteria bacterium]
MALFGDGKIRVIIELKYHRGSETDGDGQNDRASKYISSALEETEKAIMDKNYAGTFMSDFCEIICIALAVYGRDRVAVRFVEPAVSSVETDTERNHSDS